MTPDDGLSSGLDPLASSTGGKWSRASLIVLIGGRRVAMTDHLGVTVTVPPWLARATSQPDRVRADEGILNIYPADRASVSAAWISASQRPGTVVHCRSRSLLAGELHLFDNFYIDLSGHDDLQVLIIEDDLGPTAGIEEWAKLESSFGFASTPVTMEYLDSSGIKLWVDGQVQEIYGRTAGEMIGHETLEYIDTSYHEAAVNLFMNVIAEPGRMQSIRVEMVRPGQTNVWVESMVINRLADERIGAVIYLTHDITDQRAVEQAERVHNEELRRNNEELRRSHEELRRSHEEFETVANQVPAAVFRTDGEGVITFANHQWRRLVGEEGVDNLLDLVDVDDRLALEVMLHLLASPGGPPDASVEVRSRDLARVFSLSCQAVGESDTTSTRRLIGSMTDVTSTTELRHLAQHDDLTGLLNRHGIERRLTDVLADEPAEVVVAFLDLDGFKAVNDNFGHDAGDEVLRAVSARLRDALRPTDDVARYGGDEFVIVCRRASKGAEHAVAARIEDVLVAPIEFSGGLWQPGASIGLVRVRAGEDLGTLLRRADQAMYTVKRAHHHAAPELTRQATVPDVPATPVSATTR